MSVLNGSVSNDLLVGSTAADIISGFDGNDWLNGGEGNDTLRGGGLDTPQEFITFQSDTLIGGNGADFIVSGHAPFDPFTGYSQFLGKDSVLAGAGNDTVVVGGSVQSTLNGGDGQDVLWVVGTSNFSGSSGTSNLSGSFVSGFEVLQINANPFSLGLEGFEAGGSSITLTAAQFAGFSTIRNGYVVDPEFDAPALGIYNLIAADAGLYDLSARTVTSLAGLFGSSGADTLRGDANGNVLSGNAGNDLIEGLAGSDALSGGAGNDTISGGAGPDSIDGGAGSDLLSYADLTASSQAVTVDLVALRATGAAGNDTFAGIENVVTGAGNDSLLGDGAANILIAGAGNDTISGGAGNDSIDGGAGSDLLSYADLTASSQAVTVDLVALRATGAAGNDTLAGIENVLTGAGNDSLLGDSAANILTAGAGNDTISGGAGNDSIDGGAGSDLLSYADLTASSQAVTVDLVALRATGAAGNDTLAGIENVVTGAGNDSLLGDSAANILTAGAGNDTISGGAGNDSIDGGTGTDLLSYADLTASSQAVTVDLATLRATGAAGNDTLAGIENIITGAGNDSLRGDGVANTLTSGAGNDTISGGASSDSLAGADGDDQLDGGANQDTLVGGDGIDSFYFTSALSVDNVDLVLGYSMADDTILLDDAVFASVGGLGTLAASAFVIGPTASTLDHRIIFNSTTGELLYDADGIGEVAAIQFATLTSVIGSVTHAEFQII